MQESESAHGYHMKSTHSIGAIAYLNEALNKFVPNPIYSEDYFIYAQKKSQNINPTDYINSINASNLAKKINPQSKKTGDFSLENLSNKNDKNNLSLGELNDIEDNKVKKLRGLSNEEIKRRLSKTYDHDKQPSVRTVWVYVRNPLVTAYTLNRANGRCERCGNQAPFISAATGNPYLEVHHKNFLSHEGKDSIENTIALCPNCHRHAHQGKNTY